MIELTIPWPPTANNYIRHSRGRHFPTARCVAFRKEVWGIVKVARVQPLTGRLRMTLDLYPPNRVRRDIDNLAKPTIDSLMVAGCFGDDEQIDELLIRRYQVLKGGAVRVTIGPVTA